MDTDNIIISLIRRAGGRAGRRAGGQARLRPRLGTAPASYTYICASDGTDGPEGRQADTAAMRANGLAVRPSVSVMAMPAVRCDAQLATTC